jgi:hypothetical protein
VTPRRAGPPVLALLLVLHVFPFVTRPALIGGDEPHYALAAHSLATDGDADLEDDYREVEQGSNAAGKRRAGTILDRHLLDRDGVGVFAHPLGLPLLAAPLVWVAQSVAPGSAPDLVLGALGLAVTFVALLAGRDLLRRIVGEPGASVVAFSVYFATPLWFYSRTFFTEPYVWSLAVLGLWSMARDRWTSGGVVLALTLAVKETSLVVVAPVLLYVLVRFGAGRFLRAAIGPALFAIVFVARNLHLWGEPWVTFQPFHRGSVVEGTLGLLASPEHGLLWFAPLVALLPAAVLDPARRSAVAAGASPAALVIFAGYFAVTAAWLDWGGGSSYGPRLLLPGIAALAVPLAGIWRVIAPGGRWRRAWAVLAIAGFAVQWSAAVEPRAALFSGAVPDLLTRHPAWALFGVGLGVLCWRRLAKSGAPLAPSDPETMR